MDWNCLFVFRNTCHFKAVHVWFITAAVFAATVFLWSLSITFYNTPACFYDLTTTRNMLGQKHRKIEDIAQIKRAVLLRGFAPESRSADASLIGKLRRNISELTQELRQLKLTVQIYEKLGKMVETDSSLKTLGNKVHQNVLLISLPHSGDVFLGEFFNRNSQVFYLFEPFNALKYFRLNRPPDIYDSMLSSFLQGILNCDFARFKYYTDFLSLQYRAVIHRLSSRTLSAPPLCPEIVAGREYSIQECAFLRPPTLNAICKLHSHTFVKTTQEVDLQRLAQLSNADGNPEYPFRVVELVRDPRAVVHDSIQQLGTVQNNSMRILKEEIQKICSHQKHNLKFAHKARATLNDRYIRVKYEDIITNPLKTLSRLSGSLGLSMTSRDRSWVTGVLRDGFSWSAAVTGEGMRNELKSTENLLRSVTAWQDSFSQEQLRLIEDECGEVIKLLGYN